MKLNLFAYTSVNPIDLKIMTYIVPENPRRRQDPNRNATRAPSPTASTQAPSFWLFAVNRKIFDNQMKMAGRVTSFFSSIEIFNRKNSQVSKLS